MGERQSARPTAGAAIGITGHRDLRPEDIGTLEARVAAIYEQVRGSASLTPGGSAAPTTGDAVSPATMSGARPALRLLSPLAEGADRLAARVALRLGIPVVAPLPMPRPLYEATFESDASRAEFRDLLARSADHFELPLIAGHTEQDIRESGDARSLQYALVGLYLVRHAPALIALWDGRESSRRGGTPDVVRLKLTGSFGDERLDRTLEAVPPPYGLPHRLADRVAPGPLYHVVTPRLSRPVPLGEPFTVHRLTAQSPTPESTTDERA